MNVLLMTMVPKKGQKMVRDLVCELSKNGHRVFVVCPGDSENPVSSRFQGSESIKYLFVNSGNSVGRVGIIKKVLNFLLMDFRYKQGLRRALEQEKEKIELVLYATPPITLTNTIVWLKREYNATTYLMLKDIFPQNAVDMGMIKKTGGMGFVWRYFRAKERRLYRISDFIGCMSPANCRYILKENPEIPAEKVGICVNSYLQEPVLNIDQTAVRQKYGLPLDKTIFLYGGNLGKPQGLDYFVRVMRDNLNKTDRFFLICGSGNDQKTIQNFIDRDRPENVKFMASIPPDDFDELSRACDVGLVFLDHRFTIPNFPSRMLSIMLNEKPILAATDSNTDVGEVIADGDMGWWCESTDTAPINGFIDEICADPEAAAQKGRNARVYYETHYTTQIACDQILEGVARTEGIGNAK